jgi:alpha-L-arabinofuranosidase
MPCSRRTFLQQVSTAATAYSASLLFGGAVAAQEATRVAPDAVARVYIDTRRTMGAIDHNLFGSFLEHLGRAIYQGIFDPGSPLSDSRGYRKDVMELVRQLGVPMIRYPGGNFVSGYHWLDGVGPVQNRPRVLEKAWDSIETNRFGTNDFLTWCKDVGTTPLMGLNLGTGTTEQAAALVEYCNVDEGTHWSDLRREHGIAEPYKVEHWCLGNEMDGPWQIGHMTAAEYGMKAADAARQMRYVDPSLKLIACGSSGPFMPTYLQWDREVLEQCYEYVDGLSLHRYFGNDERETGGNSSKYLAMNLSMDRQIAETLAVCDYVQGRQRSAKKLWLSFDEWNVWYRARTGDAVDGHRQVAPHLLEEPYNLEDALLVGGLVNTLVRNANRVKIACLAQLVNVIAPIMTNEKGVLLNTIFYPYKWALQYARGSALDVLSQAPTYEVEGLGQVPYLDVMATATSDGKTSVFVLNRDLQKPHQVELLWEDRAPGNLAASWIITGNDLKAVNTFDAPKRVVEQAAPKPTTSNGRTTMELPPRSYTMFQWSA